MKQTILILGSEGFIGSQLVAHFKTAYSVFGIDVCPQPTNIYTYWQHSEDQKELISCFTANAFDFCINAAGSGNVGYSILHPDFDFNMNVVQPQQVLEAIRIHQPTCKYLHFSSAAVYGNPKQLPVTETDTVDPLSPYGWHKYLSENLCSEYGKVFGIPTTVLRPFSVFGPGLKKQLFWDLYQKFKNHPDQIEIWGTGNESRDFIYIRDLCRSVETIMQHSDFQSTVYNIGTGEEISVRHAATAFLTQLNPEIQIRFNNKSKPGDPINWKADISRLARLGFTPNTNFDSGINQVAQWIKSQL